MTVELRKRDYNDANWDLSDVRMQSSDNLERQCDDSRTAASAVRHAFGDHRVLQERAHTWWAPCSAEGKTDEQQEAENVMQHCEIVQMGLDIIMNEAVLTPLRTVE